MKYRALIFVYGPLTNQMAYFIYPYWYFTHISANNKLSILSIATRTILLNLLHCPFDKTDIHEFNKIIRYVNWGALYLRMRDVLCATSHMAIGLRAQWAVIF